MAVLPLPTSKTSFRITSSSRPLKPTQPLRTTVIVSASHYDPEEVQRFHNHSNSFFHPHNNPYPRFYAIDGNPPPLEQDWRLFRAQLVARERHGAALINHPLTATPPPTPPPTQPLVRSTDKWAHTIPHPEPGCLLVARQSNLGMFSNSVVLVTEHVDRDGTSALVLNMPTPLYISNLGLEEDITSAFGKTSLYIGGPMNRNLLHVLHGRGDVGGAMCIVDGVYAGGVDAASELVRIGVAKAEEFKLLAGYSGWGPWQLKKEIEAGHWWVVAASHSLILECLQDCASGGGGGVSGSNEVGTNKTSSCVGNAGGGNGGAVKVQWWSRILTEAGIQHDQNT